MSQNATCLSSSTESREDTFCPSCMNFTSVVCAGSECKCASCGKVLDQLKDSSVGDKNISVFQCLLLIVIPLVMMCLVFMWLLVCQKNINPDQNSSVKKYPSTLGYKSKNIF